MKERKRNTSMHSLSFQEHCPLLLSQTFLFAKSLQSVVESERIWINLQWERNDVVMIDVVL